MSQQIIDVPMELSGPLLSEAPVAGKPCGHAPPRTSHIKILAGREMNGIERPRANLYGPLDVQVKNIGALFSHIRIYRFFLYDSTMINSTWSAAACCRLVIKREYQTGRYMAAASCPTPSLVNFQVS